MKMIGFLFFMALFLITRYLKELTINVIAFCVLEKARFSCSNVLIAYNAVVAVGDIFLEM